MELTNRTTWFTRRTRPQALTILGLTVVVVIASCLITASAEETISDTASKSDRNDLRLYRTIVERVHSGEDYYDAAQSELRTRGYPTRSMFNWRTPLYAWLLGSLPQPLWAKVLLGLIALAAVLMAYGAVRRESG